MVSGPGLLRELHIPWPAADEGDLRTAASTWKSLAETIRDNYGMANSNAQGLVANNEGKAISAFETYWSKFAGPKGALLAAAEACDSMSDACGKYATAVAETKKKIEEAGAEVAATLILGTIGAFFTFGATEGIADSVAAGLLATVAGYIEELGTIVGAAAVDISSTVAWAIIAAGDAIADVVASGAAASVGSTVLSGAAAGVGGNAFAIAAENSIRQLFGEEPLSTSDVAKDLLISGLAGGATGGLLGKLGDMTAEQISKVLTNAADSVSTSNPQQFVDLMTLAKQLEGTTGKVSVGTLATVASQLLTTQEIDANELSRDQLVDALKRAAGFE
jgi:hypothetical protein